MVIHVVIIDDSPFMRQAISDVLNKDPVINVLTSIRTGSNALTRIGELDPKVVVFDNETSKGDGSYIVETIVKEHNIPVVVLGEAGDMDLAIPADMAGMIDFIQMSNRPINKNVPRITRELRFKIKKTVVDVNIPVFLKDHNKKDSINKVVSPKPGTVSVSAPIEGTGRRCLKTLLVIGASTGGPMALKEVITKLPGNLPAAVLIVQHMPVGFTGPFSRRLDSLSALQVREAKEGDMVQEGVVLIAPSGSHMEVVQRTVNGIYQEMIALNQGPKEHGVRPSVNVLFRSLPSIYGPNILSVILTGMGKDGASGVEEIKKHGGRAITQDKDSCAIYGMPRAIVEMGLADWVLPLDKIAGKITREIRIKVTKDAIDGKVSGFIKDQIKKVHDENDA